MRDFTGYYDKFGKKIYQGDRIMIEHLEFDIGNWRVFPRAKQVGVVINSEFRCTNQTRYRAKKNISLENYFILDKNLIVKLKTRHL